MVYEVDIHWVFFLKGQMKAENKSFLSSSSLTNHKDNWVIANQFLSKEQF